MCMKSRFKPMCAPLWCGLGRGEGGGDGIACKFDYLMYVDDQQCG